MAATSSLVLEREQSTLNVLLHPLVIINISDHYTRARVSSATPPRVMGALLGIQKNRDVEIFNSFEIISDATSPWSAVDQYFKVKQEQCKKIFPAYDFLGWYSTGEKVTTREQEIHKLMTAYNESPLFLQLDPVINPAQRDLPVTIYESELHIIKDQPQLLFSKTPYKIETGEAERISVDHVAHLLSGSGAEGTQLQAHLLGLHNAIKMMSMRVRIIVHFLEATKSGSVPTDHNLLRLVASLVNQLPAIDSSKFRDEFVTEYNDALLVTYLASVTKTATAMNDLVDKANLVFDRHQRRSRFF